MLVAVVDTERGHRGSNVEQKLTLLDITMIENKLWLTIQFHFFHLYIKGLCKEELLTPVIFARALLHLALHKAV